MGLKKKKPNKDKEITRPSQTGNSIQEVKKFSSIPGTEPRCSYCGRTLTKAGGLSKTTTGNLCDLCAKKIAGLISFGIEKNPDEKKGR